jgi:hypothetical protein
MNRGSENAGPETATRPLTTFTSNTSHVTPITTSGPLDAVDDLMQLSANFCQQP